MYKQDLIEDLAETQKINKAEASRIVNHLFEKIKDVVAKGQTVTVTGFGTFKTVEHAARTGRNPQTGKPLKIAAHTVPVFRAGKNFKNAIK